VSTELAILPIESFTAQALVSSVQSGAEATIQAGRVCAKVDFDFAVSAHEAWLAIAMEVINHLYAIERAGV